MGLNRTDFDGAYIEVDGGDVRYYCRSQIDSIRTRLLIEKFGDDDAFTLYGGMTAIDELPKDEQQLMLDALSDPIVQNLMAVLGATLEGVSPDKKGGK